MIPEDREDAILDTLLNAQAWVGGSLGVMHPKEEEEVLIHLTVQGLIGPRGCLTRKGANRAKAIQRNIWGD